LYKLLLIGDIGVGKTSLIIQYTEMIFDRPYGGTIGIDFKIHKTQINNHTIKLQIV